MEFNPAAGIVVITEDDEVLLLRRIDNGAWEIPGGKAEAGEDPAMTASRETYEETNLDFLPGSLTHICTFEFPARREANEGKWFRFSTFFKVVGEDTLRYSPVRLEEDTHDEYEWVPQHDLVYWSDALDPYAYTAVREAFRWIRNHPTTTNQ